MHTFSVKIIIAQFNRIQFRIRKEEKIKSRELSKAEKKEEKDEKKIKLVKNS